MASPEDQAKDDLSAAAGDKPAEFSADFDTFDEGQMRSYLDAIVKEADAKGRFVESICMPPSFADYLKSQGASYGDADITASDDFEGMVYGITKPK
jgi:hypothetical protein